MKYESAAKNICNITHIDVKNMDERILYFIWIVAKVIYSVKKCSFTGMVGYAIKSWKIF